MFSIPGWLSLSLSPSLPPVDTDMKGTKRRINAANGKAEDQGNSKKNLTPNPVTLRKMEMETRSSLSLSSVAHVNRK